MFFSLDSKMVKDKLSKLQLSLVEIISLLTFISLGNCLLYKFIFYKKLGISWFITNLTPQFLFLSSFKFLFISIFGLIIGCLIGYLVGNRTPVFPFLHSKPMVISSIFSLLLLFLLFQEKIPEEIYSVRTSEAFFIYFNILCGFFSTFFYAQILANKRFFYKSYFKYIAEMDTERRKNLQEKIDEKVSLNQKDATYFTLFLVIAIYLIQPLYYGSFDAKKIIKNKEKYLNKALLKDTIKDWYIIETMGDKVLLIDKKNNIKIVEYKELDFIQTDELIK